MPHSQRKWTEKSPEGRGRRLRQQRNRLIASWYDTRQVNILTMNAVIRHLLHNQVPIQRFTDHHNADH